MATSLPGRTRPGRYDSSNFLSWPFRRSLGASDLHSEILYCLLLSVRTQALELMGDAVGENSKGIRDISGA